MAKTKVAKKQTADTDSKKSVEDAFKDAFKAIDGINPEAVFLDKSALSVVHSFIDTGSLSMNAIMSGNLRGGGIPSGRIVGYAGPSGCGKTLMVLKAVANAQRKQGRYAVIWDSEIAVDMQTAVNLGCDPSKIKHCPVETVEDCRNQIVKFLDKVIADPQLHGKFILVIDSIANLASNKEVEDAQKNKHAADMGLRAKALKSMFRTVTYKCARADCPLLFTNHIYDDPAALYESIKKNQSGGKGPEYMASILVQLAHTFDKTETDAATPIAKSGKGGQVTGVTMNALTVKNRFLPPFLEAEINVNFLTGLDERAGIISMAKDMGVLEGVNSYAFTTGQFKGEKIGQRSKFNDDKHVWDQITDELDKEIQRRFKFSCDQPLLDPAEEVDEEDADELAAVDD